MSAIRLAGIAGNVPAQQSVLAYADPATMIGTGVAFIGGVSALRVAIKGNAAFATASPKRISGKRAIHGEADWMRLLDAAKLFPDAGGIVSGNELWASAPVSAEGRTIRHYFPSERSSASRI